MEGCALPPKLMLPRTSRVSGHTAANGRVRQVSDAKLNVRGIMQSQPLVTFARVTPAMGVVGGLFALDGGGVLLLVLSSVDDGPPLAEGL